MTSIQLILTCVERLVLCMAFMVSRKRPIVICTDLIVTGVTLVVICIHIIIIACKELTIAMYGHHVPLKSS